MRLFSHHDRLYLTLGGGGGNAHQQQHDSGDDKDDKAAAVKAHHHAKGGGLFIPHFHKTFGLIALINILLYVTPLYDTAVARIGQDRLMLLSCAHVILALSSFEFRVGRARNGLYTIYREMQLHTITFTLRSWSVMVGAWVFGIENMMLRSAYILVWHLVADYVTANYQPPSKETTIRRSVDGEKGYKEYGAVVHAALFVFSFSQLVGIFMMMVDTPNAVRNAMFVMAPVQISAFLATLVRKGYFSSRVSFVSYFISLMPIFFYHPWTPLEVVAMAIIATARFKFRVSKYVIWCTVAVVFGWLSGDLAALAGSSFIPSAPALPSAVTHNFSLSALTADAVSTLLPSLSL